MKKLIALCALLASAAFAGPYDNDSEISRLKPIDSVVLVMLMPDKTMSASLAKVGHITDGKPLLCFKDPDKQLVGCFLVNVKSGQVVFLQLPADETSV